MNRPRALRPGDRVAVVAPASQTSRESFERGVQEIARLGFEPVFSDAVFERGPFSAGSADRRAADFLRWWTDPSVAALIALRGGYGSVHILPRLPKIEIARSPKLFVGYSDTTSVLTWLTCHCGIPGLHGPMLDGRLARGADGYDEASFAALLQGGAGLSLAPEGVSAVRGGGATGPLYGGTLTQLAASLGTPFAFDPPAGSILFIEDVNERPYRLDRMLTQLRLAGVLDRVRALVFGEMRGCDEPNGEVRARDVIDAVAAGFDGPVLSGFPSGHTTGPLWTLPFGVNVRIETTPEATIIVEESPVA